MTTTPHANAEALAAQLDRPHWTGLAIELHVEAAALIRQQAQEIAQLQLSLDCMQQHESKLEDIERERDALIKQLAVQTYAADNYRRLLDESDHAYAELTEEYEQSVNESIAERSRLKNEINYLRTKLSSIKGLYDN